MLALVALIDVCDAKFFAAFPFSHYEDQKTKSNCTYLFFWEDGVLFCCNCSL